MYGRPGVTVDGHVDLDDKGRGTGARIKKDSFAWYKHVIETNGEEL